MLSLAPLSPEVVQLLFHCSPILQLLYYTRLRTSSKAGGEPCMQSEGGEREARVGILKLHTSHVRGIVIYCACLLVT